MWRVYFLKIALLDFPSSIKNVFSRKITLREKCPNMEFFLYLSVSFCIQSDAGKYGPEKSPYLDTFHAGRSGSELITTFAQFGERRVVKIAFL